ncbi:beta-N-acetylhexosaminidase [Kitasatospora sp. NBC_00240]|uniref:beta-N-acetylhexosaminidase n=1 Tax=Kitasatospora sp. NBC_00240 TaxID=2903567 RepID=UPI002257DF2B|nr:beta-N-acetylhexosaminidase [Kitasatospora sp. NBC_00240]MCX5208919.1 beta-N-acetylhexosaminidase [Kitasatospora sp. NBC_00240]
MRIGRAELTSRSGRIVLLVALLALVAAGLGIQRALGDDPGGAAADGASTAPTGSHRVVPAPLAATDGTGAGYTLTARTAISTPDGNPAARQIAEQLAAGLRRSTGLPLPVTDGHGARDGIDLALDRTLSEETGPEGYRLQADANGVRIAARTEEGLYRGTQTLRQLLPAEVESRTQASADWTVAPVGITDRPRYAYRGAMLDVARHFFTVDEVKAYVDRLSLYKFNHLHLHLTDDQGWRLAVPGRPGLTGIGAATEIGGTPGGFYTEADYREIVRYAQERYLTVVPEIDLPGHTNAVLTAYPELDCSGGPAAQPYFGNAVGFSLICPTDERTYAFTGDVIAQLASLTPGPYLHIGGDEVKTLAPAGYQEFVRRVAGQVRAAGKIPFGWNQTAPVAGGDGVGMLEFWSTDGASARDMSAAVGRGARVVMAPAGRAYLDMKYDAGTALGVRWAGTVSVSNAYSWNPDTELELPAGAVAGIEAPLWTETLPGLAEVDQMALPRLPALAEVGWSAQSARDWNGFRLRLAAQGPRWEAAGFGFARRPEIPWP